MQHLGVEHSPVRHDQFVPDVERNLPAVTRGKHIVCGAEVAAVQREKLRSNDFLRARRKYAERRIDSDQNPGRESKRGESEREQEIKIVKEVLPARPRSPVKFTNMRSGQC